MCILTGWAPPNLDYFGFSKIGNQSSQAVDFKGIILNSEALLITVLGPNMRLRFALETAQYGKPRNSNTKNLTLF
jgi:hypothetical protein